MTKHIVFIEKEPQPTEYVEARIIHGKGIHFECSTVSNPNTWDDGDYHEPKEEKSEYEEWKEDDDRRRYREWESDDRRPY